MAYQYKNYQNQEEHILFSTLNQKKSKVAYFIEALYCRLKGNKGKMGRLLFNTLLLVPFIFFSNCSQQSNTQERVIDFVDPFIGTDGPGNTYPGAAVPFGMVQLSPDNGLPGWDRISGYFWPDSTIAGFSHTHLTGTGAGDLYDLLLMPVNSRFSQDLWPEQQDYRPFSKFSHNQEEAHPGYYKVLLKSFDIVAELTTTKRVGFHRYTFPQDSASQIILDLGYKLNWDKPLDTYIEIEDSITVSGYRKSKGWAKDQRVYFVAKFSKPFNKVNLSEEFVTISDSVAKGVKTRFAADFYTEAEEQILVKVALSSASVEGARENMQAELPDWDFENVLTNAENNWEKELSKITIKGNEYQKRVFYSNLYHTFLTPSLHSDVNGDYKAADGTVKKAEGYNRYHTFSLWDTFRATHPLYTILTPTHVQDFINSFLGHYDETGLLPVWELAGNETNMMIGYHAIPVIVDAYFKGIQFDYEKAFEACKVSALDDNRGLDEYKKYGYIPSDGKEEGHWSVSKTLEYAYGDWCVAQFANALDKQDEYEYFIERANNWKNLYDTSSTFMRPKDLSGEFVSPFIPKEYTELFCESNAWQYFWHVQHDLQGLIDLVGKDKFTAKLDSMFTYYPDPDDKLPIFSTGMIGQYAHGNEPVHHVAYIYNLLDQPDRTQEITRNILDEQYSDKPDGFCGNEDCGQMSAWFVFSSIGFYPVNPADGIYYLTSPWVEQAAIELPNGKIFQISTENYSSENSSIESIWLNGAKHESLQITHNEIMTGGELKFVFRTHSN